MSVFPEFIGEPIWTPQRSTKSSSSRLLVKGTQPQSQTIVIIVIMFDPTPCSGRGPGYPGPPAQIPACGFPAPGSCRRLDAIAGVDAADP
jgi:hypothetical protein